MIEAMVTRGSDTSPSPNDDGSMRKRRRTLVARRSGGKRSDVDNIMVMTTMTMKRRKRILQR
jgi:hypothetical protein